MSADTNCVAARLTEWRANIPLFAHDVFGIDPWESVDGTENSQAGVMRAIPKHRAIAVRSGHKVGKTNTIAVVSLWSFVCLVPGTRVVITAPTDRQVNEMSWREIRDLIRRARQRGFQLSDQEPGARADGGLKGAGGRQIIGYAAKNADAFSGVSAPLSVYFGDEYSGVSDKIDEAIEGNSAGGAWKILFGNPTQTSGPFFRAFHEEAHLYRTFHISSENTPTARGVRRVPGLSTAEWIARQRQKYAPHETHAVYAVRVKGEFPGQASKSVFSLEHLALALERWTKAPPNDVLDKRLEVGVDVARFGDDRSVIMGRRGRYVYEPAYFAGLDTYRIADEVRKYVREKLTMRERAGLVKKPRAKVDGIGIGAGVVDILKRTARTEMEVIDVISSQSAQGDDEDKFANLRAQLWFDAASFVARGGMLPPSGQLRADCLATEYSFTANGRSIRIESKDDIRERLGRSPDEGDAFCLCVHEPRTVPSNVRVSNL